MSAAGGGPLFGPSYEHERKALEARVRCLRHARKQSEQAHKRIDLELQAVEAVLGLQDSLGDARRSLSDILDAGDAGPLVATLGAAFAGLDSREELARADSLALNDPSTHAWAEELQAVPDDHPFESDGSEPPTRCRHCDRYESDHPPAFPPGPGASERPPADQVATASERNTTDPELELVDEGPQ